MILQIGVKVLLRSADGKYLLIRRKEAFQDGASWDIPGGRIEPEEPLDKALMREVKEEIGVELTANTQLLAAQDIFVEAKDLHVVRLTYLAEFDGDIVIGDEHTEFNWLSINELKAAELDKYLAEIVPSL